MSDLKFGIELPQHLGFSYLKELVLAAERLGYDSVWVRDHLLINPEEMARFPQGYIEDGSEPNAESMGWEACQDRPHRSIMLDVIDAQPRNLPRRVRPTPTCPRRCAVLPAQ